MEQKYDALDSWREEVGIKNSKGEVKHYEGGCEWDPTAEAIKAYLEEQKKKEREFAKRQQEAYREIADREKQDIKMMSGGIEKFKEGMER